MAYTLKVSTAQDLPENLVEFYNLISTKDKIKNWDVIGKLVCVKNERDEIGLFLHEQLKDYSDREWFLPMRGAPLFIFSPEELIVVAPCELPTTLIAVGL